MVKRRDAHIGFRRQLINAEVFRVLALDALQHAANQAEVRLPAYQRQQRPAARSQQHMVKNFADNLLSENTRIQRPFHHV